MNLTLRYSVGGTRIFPADIVILDADGGVCVRREQADEILKAAEARCEREKHLREKLFTGEMSYDLHGLREIVETKRRKA